MFPPESAELGELVRSCVRGFDLTPAALRSGTPSPARRRGDSEQRGWGWRSRFRRGGGPHPDPLANTPAAAPLHPPPPTAAGSRHCGGYPVGAPAGEGKAGGTCVLSRAGGDENGGDFGEGAALGV